MSARGTKECPFCAETIQATARGCRFCGYVFPPAGDTGVPAPAMPSDVASPPPTALTGLEVPDLLTDLVAKSLVLYEEDEHGGGRYRLFETVRQYARDRLVEAGDAEAVRERHRDWFLALAEQAEPELEGPDQGAWMDRLEWEHDNLRAALDWSREAVENGLRLARALARFWHVRGYWTEGREQASRLLALPEAQARTAARAQAVHCVGLLIWAQWEYGTARALLEERVAIFREVGNREGMAGALVTLGRADHFGGDDEAAREHLEESLAIFRELGVKKGIAAATNGLALVARNRGELGKARTLLAEAHALDEGTDARMEHGDLLVEMGSTRLPAPAMRNAWPCGASEETPPLASPVRCWKPGTWRGCRASRPSPSRMPGRRWRCSRKKSRSAASSPRRGRAASSPHWRVWRWQGWRRGSRAKR